MALGSNIEYRASALFQATLDEKTAKQLEGRFTELSKKAADMSKEEFTKAFQNLGAEINKSLAKLKLQPINMEEIIKLPQLDVFSKFGAELGKRLNDGIKGAVGDVGGIADVVSKQIAELNRQRIEKQKQYDKASRMYDRYDRAMGLSDMYPDEFSQLPKKEDINAQASEVLENYNTAVKKVSELKKNTEDYRNALIKLKGLEEGSQDYNVALNQVNELKKGVKEYNVALLMAFEAYDKLMRMKATVDENMHTASDEIVLMYDIKNLNALTKQFIKENDKQIQKVGEGATAHYDSLMSKLQDELDQIDIQIKEIQQSDPEIINKTRANEALKSLNEIEAAYSRILNKTGSINKTAAKNISEALDYNVGTQSLTTLSKGYNKSSSSNENWEVQYQWLIKFVREYEAYQAKINETTDSRQRSHMKETLQQYTALYEQLQPMAANAENMLRNVLNMANNMPLVGMGGADKEPQQAATTDNSNSVNEDISQQNKLVEQYNSNKEKTLALLKKEQLSYDEILYLVKEVQTEYAKSFYADKNWELGDNALGLMTSVYNKLRRGDMIDARFDRAINGVGMSAEDGAKILSDYQNKQLGISSEDVDNARILAEENAKVQAETDAKAKAEKAAADEARRSAEAAEKEAESKEHLLNLVEAIVQTQKLNTGKEVGTFYNSQTGSFEQIGVGGDHEYYRTFGDYVNASSKYDTSVHSHSPKVAAPSVLGDSNDLQNWIKAFDVIKQHIIKAREDIVLFNLSLVSETQLKEIAEKYRVLSQQIFQELLSPSKITEYGSFSDADDAINMRLKQELQTILQQYPGVMTSIPLPQELIYTPPKENTIKHKPLSFVDEYAKASEDVKQLVKELAVLEQQMANLSNGEEDQQFAMLDQQYETIRSQLPINMREAINDYGIKWDEFSKQIFEAAQAQEKLDSIIQDDDTETIQKENGALEDKLELLRDIAEEYGSDITQKQRDRFEELNQKDMDSGLTPKEEDRYWELGEKISDADEALASFGDTYDKVILKLANGKKVEIVPDDKGLRTFSKIADGYDGEYDGIEIEDVIFERVKQEAMEADRVVDDLNESIEKTHQLNQGSNVGGGIGDASSEELKAAQEEADGLRTELQNANERARAAEINAEAERDLRITTENALSEEIGEKWSADKRARDAEAETERLKQELADVKTKPINLPNDTAVETSTEVTQINALKEAIEAVTTAVDLKTKAFESEDEVVKTIVSNEINALTPLKDTLESIGTIITNIQSNNNIGAGLSNIAINVNHAETQQNDLARVIDAIGNIKITSDPVADVGNVLATENTLSAIKTAVESINSKAQNGFVGTTNNAADIKSQSTSQKNDLSDQVDTINTLLTLYKELGYQQDRLYAAQEKYDELERYSAQERIDELRRLIAMGERSIEMTDLLKEQFRAARESGSDGQFKSQSKKTSDSAVIPYKGDADGANIDQKLIEQIKTAATSLLKYKTTLQEANQLTGDLEVGINNLSTELTKVSDKEGLTVWSEHFKQFKNASSIVQTLVKDYQALGAMQAKANAETDPTKLAQYLDNIQILQDRIATKSVDVNVSDDRFEEARQRAYNITQHELQQKEELVGANQVEAEIIKRLIKLYEQLGKARAQGNMTEVTRIRRLISADRSQLSSVDYATDMKFKSAKDKGYSAERTKAENVELKEQEATIKNLISLYQKFGDFKERAENADDGMSEFYSGEARKIESQIIAETQKLNVVDDALQKRFDEAYYKGKDIAQTDILKGIYSQVDSDSKKETKTRNQDIEKLIKSYEKLGKLQAQFTQNGSVKTENDIDVLERLVRAEAERLGLTNEQVAILKSRMNLVRAEEEDALAAEQREKTRLHYIKEEDAARKKAQREDEKAQQKRLQQEKRYAQKEAMVGKAGSAIGRAEGTWLSAIALDDVLPDDFKAKVGEYYKELDILRKKQNAIKNSDGIVSDEQKEELIAQTTNVNKLTDEIGGLLSEYQRLSGDNVKVIGADILGNSSDLKAYEQQLADAVMAATNGKAQIKGFDATTKTLNYTVKTGAYEFTEYSAAVRGADHALVSVQGTTKKAETIFDGLKRKTKEIFMYLGGSSIIYRAFSEVKRGIQYVREIDSALTELKKVTDETAESYDRFLDAAAKTGAKIGSTISDFTQATAEFARLGYNIDLASEMAEAAIVYTNVGDGIEDVSAASESIISTMKGFGMKTSESMEIVDRFNEVGKILPVDNYIG